MAARLRPEAAEPQGAHEGGGAPASWWGEEGTRAAVYGVEADLGPRPKSRGGLPKPVTPPQPRLSTGRRATPGVSPPAARGKAGYRSPYKAPAVAPRPAGGSPKRAGTSAVPSRASSSRASAAHKRVVTAPPRMAGAASSSGASARTSARAEPGGHEDEHGYSRVEPWEAEYDEQSDEPWELQGEAWEDTHGLEEEVGTGGEAEEVGRRAGGGVGGFSNLQKMAEQHPDLLQALLGMHRDSEGRISGDTLRQVEAALREEGQPAPSRGSWRGPPPAKSPREGPSLRCVPAVGKSRVEVREETEAEEANAAKAIQARVRGNLSRKKTRALRSKTGTKARAPRSPKRAGSVTPVKKESALKQKSSVKFNKKNKVAAQPLSPPRSQASERVMEALAQDLYTELMNKAAAKIQVAWKKKRRGRKGGFVQREVKILERRESKQHKDSREVSVKKIGSPSRPRPHRSMAREDLLADVPSSNGVPAPRLGPTKKLALEALEKGSKPAQIFVHLERSTKDGMSVANHVLKFHARANQGGIPNRELCDIVPEILPTGSAAQVGFVQAMLRAHGGDVASMPELRAILKDCRQAAAAGERLLQRPTAATTTLEDFTELLNSDLKLAQRHFSEIDDNSDGKLTLPQVAQLFLKVREYSSSTEVQILVTYLFRMFGMQTPTPYTFGGLCKAMSLFQAKSKLSPEKKNPGVLHRIGPIPIADLRAELGAIQEQSHGDFLSSSGAASSAGITALTAAEVSRPLLGPILNELEEAAPLHPAYHVRTEGKSQMLQHWTEKVHADRENKKHAAIRKEERRKVESMTLRDLYRSLPNNSNLKRSIAATRLGHAAQIMRIMREGRANQALYSEGHMQAQVQAHAHTTGLAWSSGPGASGPVPDLARPIGAEVLQQTVPAAASSPDRIGVQHQPALSYHAVAGGSQAAPLLSEANWAASPTDIRNAAGAVVSELEATLSKYLHFVEGQGSGSPGTAAEAVGVAALGGTVAAASAPRVTDLPATSPRRPEQPSPDDCPAAGPIEGGWSGFGLAAPPAPPLPSREAGGLPLDLPVPGRTGFAPLLPSAIVSHPPHAEGFQFYAEAEYQPAAALPLSGNGWTNLQQPSPPAFAEARPAGPLQVYPRYYPAAPPAAFAAPALSVQTGAGVPTGGLTPLSALAAAQRSALARAELETAYTETWRQAQAVFEE